MTQNASFASMALTTADWFRYNELDSSFKKAGNIMAAKSAALGSLVIAVAETAVSTILQVAGLLVYPITSHAYSVITKHTKDSLSTITAAFQKVMQSQKKEIISPIIQPLQNRWARLKRGINEIGTQLKMKSHVALGVCEKHKGKILGVALVTTLIGLSFFFQAPDSSLIDSLNVTKPLLNNTCEVPSLNISNATEPLLNRILEAPAELTPPLLNISNATEPLLNRTLEAPAELTLPMLNISNAREPLLNNTCEAPPLNVSSARKFFSKGTSKVLTDSIPKQIEAIKENIPSFEQKDPELPKEVTELYTKPVNEVWGKLADQTREG